MSTGKTTYLGLHRWEPDDDFLRTEFNENSDKLDEELEMMQKEMTGEFSALRSELTEGLSAVETALGGKASSAHNHNASDITGGTLPVARGGTGNTSVDTTPTSGSTKMVTSGGVYTALSGKAAASHTHDYAASSHNHAASAITSGTLGVARGGTGKASWTANQLVYPSAATTMAQLAFPSAAGSVLRQGTSGAPYWTSLADLVTAMGTAKIQTGSYTGTGTYGQDNPNRLTFNFEPKFIFVTSSKNKASSTTGSFLWLIAGSQIFNTAASYVVSCSVSSKTFSWYNNDNASNQCNAAIVYNYIALG